jgi:transaldolase
MSKPPLPSDLNIKIFADGADLEGIREMSQNPLIQGFTTNPTLMRKAGVDDYKAFALEALKIVTELPISFEVFADEFDEMERQAMEIASWGANVNVKIPITNTKGESAAPLVERLSANGVVVNVTAMFTLEQVRDIVAVLDPGTPAILSVFAGRVADSGRDPIPHMTAAVDIAKAKPKLELLWASPRELLNIIQANDVGCHIITVTNDVLKKLSNVGKDLGVFSRETVQMFYDDATAAGYTIDTKKSNAAE